MRKDSTTLIRKYLDEMKRLEQELALYRRGNKQLKEELKEAKDDLQKDEEIFEEKMREMKDFLERMREESQQEKTSLCVRVVSLDMRCGCLRS